MYFACSVMERTKRSHPQLHRKSRPYTGDTFSLWAVATDTHYSSVAQIQKKTGRRLKKSIYLPLNKGIVSSKITFDCECKLIMNITVI